MLKSRIALSIVAYASVAALSLMLTNCSNLQGGPFGGGPHMGSFLGVNFGDQSGDVLSRFPEARPETSPYGAETIRLTKVRTGLVVYDYVLFEFLWRGGGMQLVMAGFGPAYANAVRSDLQAHLGTPNQFPAGQSNRETELRWTLDDGTEVTFNGRAGLLVIIGPHGKVLEGDVKARQARQAGDLPS